MSANYVIVELTVAELALICDALAWSAAKNHRLAEWTRRNAAAAHGHRLRADESDALVARLDKIFATVTR